VRGVLLLVVIPPFLLALPFLLVILGWSASRRVRLAFVLRSVSLRLTLKSRLIYFSPFLFLVR
jgi:hypothetical protein